MNYNYMKKKELKIKKHKIFKLNIDRYQFKIRLKTIKYKEISFYYFFF